MLTSRGTRAVGRGGPGDEAAAHQSARALPGREISSKAIIETAIKDFKASNAQDVIGVHEPLIFARPPSPPSFNNDICETTWEPEAVSVTPNKPIGNVTKIDKKATEKADCYRQTDTRSG